VVLLLFAITRHCSAVLIEPPATVPVTVLTVSACDRATSVVMNERTGDIAASCTNGIVFVRGANVTVFKSACLQPPRLAVSSTSGVLYSSCFMAASSVDPAAASSMMQAHVASMHPSSAVHPPRETVEQDAAKTRLYTDPIPVNEAAVIAFPPDRSPPFGLLAADECSFATTVAVDPVTEVVYVSCIHAVLAISTQPPAPPRELTNSTVCDTPQFLSRQAVTRYM